MTAVLNLITAMEQGGAQRHALEAATHLHTKEVPQYLYAGPQGPLDQEAKDRLGKHFGHIPEMVWKLDPWQDLSALRAIQRLILSCLRKHNTLIIHTNSSKAGMLGRWAGHLLRQQSAYKNHIKIIHTVHGFGFDAMGPKLRPILVGVERCTAGLADALTFVSQQDLQTARKYHLLGLGKQQSRTYITRSGVDSARFAVVCSDLGQQMRHVLREQYQIPAHAPVFVTIANMKPQKDPLFHLEIMKAYHNLYPQDEAHFFYLGDGPLMATFKKSVYEAPPNPYYITSLEKYIHPVGFVSDPLPYLAAADGFLLASLWEGLPRTVLEATAAGRWSVVRHAGWANDIQDFPSVDAFDMHTKPATFAERLHHRWQEHRANPAPIALPEAFTQAGMLASIAQIYQDLLHPSQN